MKDSELTYKKWLGWLARLDEDVTLLWHNRQMWNDLRAMIDANSAIPHAWFFLDWVTTLYVGGQAMGIRRQADTKYDVASLARLLKDIGSKPGVLSRDRLRRWHIEQVLPTYGNDEAEAAEIVDMTLDTVTAKFLKPDGSAVRGDVIATDAAGLQEVGERVERFATLKVAHLSTKELRNPPSWNELNAAMDALGDLLTRYSFLLTGSGRARVAPVVQTPWQQAFTVPWISRDDN